MIWIVTQEYDFMVGGDAEIRSKLLSAFIKEYPLANHEDFEKKLTGAAFLLEASEDTIRDSFMARPNVPSIVLSSIHPEDKGFSKKNVFSVISLRGEYFPFTKGDRELGLSEESVLEQRLGLKITKSNKTMKNIAGAHALKKDILYLLFLSRMKLDVIAGIFAFGTAGSGKSYAAECLAGEMGRYFVDADFPYIMSLPSPTRVMDDIFYFLEDPHSQREYLMLIDEIEKMFDFQGRNFVAKQIFGKLLTKLNNIYASKRGKILFFATANNITEILEYSPEFLRRGRFNRLYFLGYPKDVEAEEVFEYYKTVSFKQRKRALSELYDKFLAGDRGKEVEVLAKFFDKITAESLSISDLAEHMTLDFDTKKAIRFFDTKYGSIKVAGGDRFIYSPPEIQAITEELQNKALIALLEEENICEDLKMKSPLFVALEKNDTFILEVSESIIPLQLSAAKGIEKQVAQSKNYGNSDIGEISPFMVV